MMKLLIIFFATIFTNNITFTYILGMCPFISLSRSMKTAVGMSAAVVFVVVLTAAINWPIYYYILVPHKSEIIYFIVFIIIIAATVQLLEMIMGKFFPVLEVMFGIFLPLITVNCIVLAVSLFMVLRNYSFWESIVFSFGSSVGWMFAIIVVAAINEKLNLTGDVPEGLKGAGIVLIIAGIISLAFLGFAGMVSL
jgi:Na+-transporting NADH:ubiquinone oxidoreductase subunit E